MMMIVGTGRQRRSVPTKKWSFLAVGDIMLSRMVDYKMKENPDLLYDYPYSDIKDLIDADINFANLKSLLEIVGQRIFGPDTKLRMRPKFYPFVEPGNNGEYTCFLCGGEGCKVCKHTGWLEIVGAGLIHPEVLKAGGIDPEKYSGLAFGFGLTRLAMLKYGINDTRLFNSGDLKFLEQF